MSYFSTQNPGIGGLDEITDSEALFLQNFSSLSYAQGDVLYYNGTNLARLPAGTNGQVLTTAGAAANPSWTSVGAGTVTSVGWTGGIVSIATATTTPAFTIAGTSGGIPYFSGATTWATSAALEANAIVIGGGTGVAPATTTTGTGVLTALGVAVGSAGAFVTFNGALGTPSSGTGTNITGIPAANILAGSFGAGAYVISTSLQAATIELGHATDTTLARVSAGVVSIEGSNILVSGGALGTPSSGTLTNATGLPVAGITASTVTALGVGSIELGHATDTTLSRSAAGVLAVEGVVIPSISSTNVITNKNIQPRIVSAASYTTDTGTSLNMDNLDIFVITAQAGALLFNSPGGTLVQGQKLIIRIKDNGTARALTWNAVFRAMGTALPSTTVLSKTLYLGFFYNSTDVAWDLVASAQEA